MAKELDYSRIANKLVLIYSGHKTDNTLSVWTKEFKDILNAQEVKRLYELFSGALCLLVSTGGRKLTWTDRANKDNFTSKWCKSVFEKHGIQTVFGPTLGPDGKALHPRTNYPHKVAVVIEQPIEEPIKEAVVEESVQEPTLEELIAQKQQELDALYHQKAVADAKKALAVILEFAGMSVDKLVELIKLANE